MKTEILGKKVECIDSSCENNGKTGVIKGFLANALKVEFADGSKSLYLANQLKDTSI